MKCGDDMTRWDDGVDNDDCVMIVLLCDNNVMLMSNLILTTPVRKGRMARPPTRSLRLGLYP